MLRRALSGATSSSRSGDGSRRLSLKKSSWNFVWRVREEPCATTSTTTQQVEPAWISSSSSTRARDGRAAAAAAGAPFSSSGDLIQGRSPSSSPPFEQRGGGGWGRSISPSLRREINSPPRRGMHTEGLYIHHAIPGSSRGSAAISIGIVHALERLIPGMGYFRPIDETTIGGNRAQLMKQIFGFKDEVQAMQGVTQHRAFQHFNQNRGDDVLEEIFKAYDALKKRHDFVVIEGTNLRGFGGDVTSLNAQMASMLGASALFTVDARGVVGPSGKKGTQEDIGEGLQESAKLSDIVFKAEKVDVLGSIVHGVDPAMIDSQVCSSLFKDINVPLAGVIPDEPLLHTMQVQDVVTTLGAEVLYDVRDPGTAMSTNVSKCIMATAQLDFMLGYIPAHSEPTKGAIVIFHASRSDILLGLLHLSGSQRYSNIAALVLTGGVRPHEDVEFIVKEQASRNTLPVLLSPYASFETAAMLSRVEPDIRGTSFRKIERSQLIFDANVNLEFLAKTLLQERPIRMNPKLFQHNLFTQAQAQKQRIVLPEGEEPRTIQAAAATLRQNLADITLVGNQEKIEAVAKQLRADISPATIVDPSTSENLDKYTDFFYELRKKKGVTKEQARSVLLADVNYFGTCMVGIGDADGMVSGALNTTANTVRPALQIIKTPPDLPLVSSIFFMCLPDKVLVYGDCAINSSPTSEELATIAIQSADTAAAFGVEPRIALLSYATGTSNTGPLIQKVIDATAIAKKKRPDLPIEGPLQYDAAVNPETARTKMKTENSPVAGQATVLIFPDLNTGNNTYKAVQQSTGGVAMGPLLQGLRKPVNDLSRGCTVVDIVTTIALTAVQSIAIKNSQAESTQSKPSSEVAA